MAGSSVNKARTSIFRYMLAIKEGHSKAIAFLFKRSERMKSCRQVTWSHWPDHLQHYPCRLRNFVSAALRNDYVLAVSQPVVRWRVHNSINVVGDFA
jgi:hypothetical protein